MQKQIIVYSTNDCIECTLVKQVLTQAEIPFEERNIAENPKFQAEVEQYGFLGVPVTVYAEKAVKGFTNELKEIIELAQKS